MPDTPPENAAWGLSAFCNVGAHDGCQKADTCACSCHRAVRADRLLSEAMYLGMYGERPPGGEDATWAKWFCDVESHLREGASDDA